MLYRFSLENDRMSQLNYNHLRYFWAVAHEGNLTRTAEKLN
ncbi:MAG: LysR family transcriptional regulator, partial [Alphaproteobacteria bacterium]|nr:LysR family transcriptional regulator [Alphaproteobacteria bacterium]